MQVPAETSIPKDLPCGTLMLESPDTPPVSEVIVLGAGSAGLLTALALRRRVPGLKVTIVRSPDLGVIGVGEGTTAAFPRFLFEQLGLAPQGFYEMAQPTWKLGLKFLWGPRPEFFYTFETEIAAFTRNCPGPVDSIARLGDLCPPPAASAL